MLDIGWSELLLIGIVALIVVGPKDLPHLFHSLGRIMARVRAMGREFTSAMEDAARSSGIGEAAGSLRDMRSLTTKKGLGLDALDRAADRFDKWEPKMPSSKQGAKTDPAAPTPAETPDAEVPTAEVPGAADAQPEAKAEAPSRSLHPVRRSDMKDD
ncbi:Sec-independent protein translocase protein TatB [Paracoccus sp. 1_MG-2023]|uniref:Sec-independent protein translocase protein TatB n=1 Tax=unclassified Paracoccus (in: a-proteobacteria) TaxID=2688777 RepID=UPI001C088831|nr:MULTISPECIES: Sec-independent protein translocase protein TatB [unclassified Paracoccus (in: a-proteobacteria)]MBU2958476.1 Sec-independent protein translocase protein TatB [Paracoccus sp. C2R09]MDO6668539.1 Sec-independent protein translocase protein TatB [Paracoccus sp. 1_MG-2023]